MPSSFRSAKGYSHYQTEPSDTWLINHKRNLIPVVQVYVIKDGMEQRILPKEVIIVDLDNVRIEFTTPITGRAVLL